MKSDYTNRQKKIFSDYSIKSDHELEKIIENQHKFRPEIIPVIRDILAERVMQTDTHVEKVTPTESFVNESENDVIADTAFEENFFSPKGRIGRDKYFLRTVLLNIPFGILYFGSVYVDFSLDLILLLQLVILVCLILRLIQTFKRFHDINASGWHSLWTLIPGVNVVLWLVLILVKGTPGENKYGPLPAETKHFNS
jgi:uncharacterized membrane protein YhaH (DUF805 family)